MKTLRTVDVLAVYRDVQVEETCPKCKTPLRDAEDLGRGLIRRYDYVLYYTEGQLAEPQDEKVPLPAVYPGKAETQHRTYTIEDGMVVPGENRIGELLTDSADQDLCGSSYFCQECGFEFACGRVERVEARVGVQADLDLLANKQLWSPGTSRGLALRFIEEQGLAELFKKFLEDVAKQENDFSTEET